MAELDNLDEDIFSLQEEYEDQQHAVVPPNSNNPPNLSSEQGSNFLGESWEDLPNRMMNMSEIKALSRPNINININIDLLILYKVHQSLSKGTHLTAFAQIGRAHV